MDLMTPSLSSGLTQAAIVSLWAHLAGVDPSRAKILASRRSEFCRDRSHLVLANLEAAKAMEQTTAKASYVAPSYTLISPLDAGGAGRFVTPLSFRAV